MYNIIERGGRLIIMSHVGRPYDKKTKTLTVKQDDAVDAVVSYLQRKLRIKFAIPKFHVFQKEGIEDVDTSINWLIHDLRARKIGGIYLPNTRWFAGEEDKGEKMERLAVQLAGLADVYVNDAFGSWQPHTSTYYVTKYLPSFAGLCMQDELSNVRAVLEPKRPFLAIVAGAKYDTKIGPLTAIYKRVDHLILGGLIYNTFLCAKYGVKIKGVEDSDIALAKELVEQDKIEGKVLELPLLVESDTLEGRIEGKFRTVDIKVFFSYVV
jgi:phosphoglycerate kinase